MNNWQITEWVHHFIREQVKPGEICMDATMGNGNDTVFLSRMVGPKGRVLAFDIQEQALRRTEERLKAEHCSDNCQLILQSHEYMGEYAQEGSVSCITFNFGYLPGGNHSLATRAESSLRAIECGLKLLKKQGLMTLCVYSGGDSGFAEKDAILEYVRRLDPKEYLVIQSEYANRPNHPPVPVLIVKI